jgi:gluconate 5-dehydrogenase
MAEAGAQVVIIGRREEPLRDAVATIGADRCSYVIHDITDLEAATSLVERISEDGPITILVNNAGIHLRKRAVDTTLQEFQRVLDVHLLGAFALSQAVIPGMQAAGHGSMVFMASMASLIGLENVVAYAAAKSAYLGVVRTMAAELAGDGIRVNAIAPGWIDSPMLRQSLDPVPERKARILNRTPMHDFGEPDDVGWAVVYLSSPAAKFITGALLPVDGGVSIAL